METNNLTPDENLKEPPYYSPEEEPVSTCDTIGYEEMAEGGATIIAFMFTALFIAAVIIVVSLIQA